MLYIEYSGVFQNLGPRGRVWSGGMLGLSLGGRSGNSRFGFLARAKDSPLERAPMSRVPLERPSSDHRAINFRIQYFYCFADRSSEGFLARAKPLNLDLCSSVESLARATLLFSANFAKCFLSVFLYLYPILSILRPSLRLLDEDTVVEHTKAN